MWWKWPKSKVRQIKWLFVEVLKLEKYQVGENKEAYEEKCINKVWINRKYKSGDALNLTFSKNIYIQKLNGSKRSQMITPDNINSERHAMACNLQHPSPAALRLDAGYKGTSMSISHPLSDSFRRRLKCIWLNYSLIAAADPHLCLHCPLFYVLNLYYRQCCGNWHTNVDSALEWFRSGFLIIKIIEHR